MTRAVPSVLAAVPLVDLSTQHDDLFAADFIDGITATLERGDFINGEAVRRFEAEFAAAHSHPRRCVAVSSGLDALRLALLAFGVKARVIVPALTFAATWEAVVQAGAILLPADVDEDGLLDPQAVEALPLKGAAAACVPVHLYGRLADVPALRGVLPDGCKVIEDAAQAHGAWRVLASGREIRAGEEGDAAAYSFYPSKPLGAIGDAGAVVTPLDVTDALLRALREHGQRAKGEHVAVGYTARMDTIQALALLSKLPRLWGWNQERRDIAYTYNEQLQGVGDLWLPTVEEGDAVHVYAVRTADPGALAAHLAERGIATGRHYSVPLHLAPAFAWHGPRGGSFPVAERIAATTLSLPCYAGMTESQQERVVEAVWTWWRQR